ncbi:10109_t:CDS:2, partial [Ambispora leptoticha]
KNRDLVKEIEETYAMEVAPTLNMSKEEFYQMQDFKRQIIMQKLIESIEYCQELAVREQMQQKYRELLGVELESLGQMHDTEDIENEMFKEQQEKRQKPKPEIFPPSKPYHEYYKPHKDDFPRNPPPIILISPTDSTKSNNEDEEDQWILKDRYSENRTKSWIKQQEQHSRLKHESLYGDQDHREEMITTHKRTRSYDSNISYPTSDNPRLTEWRKQNKVRRELYEKQQREEITSEDEREMDKVEQEIENEGLNRPIRYQQQQRIYYQNEAGSSTDYTPNYTPYESDYTKH